MNSSDITFIVPCMNRLEYLKQTLPDLLLQAKTVLVCYDQESFIWARSLESKYLELIPVCDKKYFNLSQARNIGARAAASKYLAFIDCDLIIMPDFVQELEKLLVNYQPVVFDKCGPGYSGFMCCTKEAWKLVEGYDEDLTNYGYEDSEFQSKLEVYKYILNRNLSSKLAYHIEHKDSDRVANYSEKDKDISFANNTGIGERKVYEMSRLAREYHDTLKCLKCKVEVPRYVKQLRTNFATCEKYYLLYCGRCGVYWRAHENVCKD